MALAGAAWRGYFPVGNELTSGRPDVKEGIYFGSEHPADHPRVRAGIPLHGANLMPDHPADLGPVVLAWVDAMTELAHAVLRGLARSLDLAADWFTEHYTADPTVLFRIFNYPPEGPAADGGPQWGVGEHTDYGLLTILKQDHHGGLQVRSLSHGWIEAPPLPGTFVCNIGDMLDRLTGGHYRSTPHRVIPSVGHHRLSWPFFLDPAWDADVRPVGRAELAPGADESRWDGANLHEFAGTYGDYLLAKVGKVFPALRSQVL
jgi:isopenicillin N synthase-like dioxygenase